jgi:hypothetical protein
MWWVRLDDFTVADDVGHAECLHALVGVHSELAARTEFVALLLLLLTFYGWRPRKAASRSMGGAPDGA